MVLSSTLPKWLSDGIECLRKMDIDGWMSMYSPNAVHKFPYAPEGTIRRLEGYSTIEVHLKKVFGEGWFKYGSLENVSVYGDPETELVIKAVGKHTRLDNTPFELDYVWIISRKEGKIITFLEYVNPFQLSAI